MAKHTGAWGWGVACTLSWKQPYNGCSSLSCASGLVNLVPATARRPYKAVAPVALVPGSPLTPVPQTVLQVALRMRQQVRTAVGNSSPLHRFE